VEVEEGILRVNGDTVTILTTDASARTWFSERDGMQRQESGRQEETPR